MSIVEKTIQSVQNSQIAFSKFITANDAGATGAHQAGFHITKSAWAMFLREPGIKGANKDAFITIRWQDSIETASRFIYYGVKTRNEYRLTRFGRGFPYLEPTSIGDLLVIAKKGEGYYEAFVLESDDEIEDFFNAFGISATETNGIIPKSRKLSAEEILLKLFKEYIAGLKVEFPKAEEVSTNARNIFNTAYKVAPTLAAAKPDDQIVKWLNTEFELFKALENNRYGEKIKLPFKSVENLIEFSNTILNRRKSRAGKSLENHLSEIFSLSAIKFAGQPHTEKAKKPDFIFPSAEAYHDKNFPANKLVFLGAKTTCKDRWRQVINEADRIETKHLFTLQQGISENQLEEMEEYKVRLVVPQEYITSFPKNYRDKILPLKGFVELVKSKQY